MWDVRMWDVRMWTAAVAAAAVLSAAPASDIQSSLRELLSRDLRFSTADLADLEKGKVVAHDLRESGPGAIGAVGAVRIEAARSAFVDRYRDIVRFKRGPDVLQIGRFSTPPAVDDLAPLALDTQDVDLRDCRVRDCDIRLPAAIIARVQREIDWKAPDADARAAAFFRQVLLDHVRAYVSGGADRIAEYNDQKQPVRPMDAFNALLKGAPYIDQLAPGLRDHLREFPRAPLTGADDFLYWSKEKFGYAPFVSVTHVTLVPPAPEYTVIVSKDVYASRYFDASLSVTIAADSAGSADAFYLVYVNRSQASALKGAFSGLRRSIVVRRAVGALEQNLALVKRRLEAVTAAGG
jgi:hypothetical protein